MEIQHLVWYKAHLAVITGNKQASVTASLMISNQDPSGERLTEAWVCAPTPPNHGSTCSKQNGHDGE